MSRNCRQDQNLFSPMQIQGTNGNWTEDLPACVSATCPADESKSEKEVRQMNKKEDEMVWTVRSVLTQSAQVDVQQAEPEKTHAHLYRWVFMNMKDVEDGEKDRMLALITWNRLSLFDMDQEMGSFLRMCVFECLVHPGPWKHWHSLMAWSQRPPAVQRHHGDIYITQI